MHTKVTELITFLRKQENDAKIAIADAAMESNFDRVEQLSAISREFSSQIEQWEASSKSISKTLTELTKTLSAGPHTKSPAKILCIEVYQDPYPHSASTSKTCGRHVIQEPTAAESLAKFLALASRESHKILQKLADSKPGRFLSRQPEKEFINPVKGTPYSSLQIGHSSWHVKTATSTAQKIEEIEHTLNVLGVSPDCILVSSVSKDSPKKSFPTPPMDINISL